MRVWAIAALGSLSLAACASATTYKLFEREIGRTIADVTVIAGQPESFADLPDGRRAFRWVDSALVPRGGPRCVYTLIAVREGRPQSLAAWRVVEIAAPLPGCGPLLDAERNAM